MDARSGEELPLDSVFAGAAAYCGLANPGAFWQTLDALGLGTVPRDVFPDHHRYTTGELAALGAPVLLTTEKDVMNLPSALPAARILWLRIGLALDRPAELLALIERAQRP